jgi:hypothetical protein
MTDWAISFSMGGWTLMRKEPDGRVYSTAPMPSLESALRQAENDSGGPVIIKLVTRS